MDKNIVTIRGGDGNIINMEVYKYLPSTLDVARQYANEGYPDRYVVFSERRAKPSVIGKKQETDYEEGMYMSCILRPSLFPVQASLLGALSAVAFVTALDEHTKSPLGIGWVSDIYCDGIRSGGVTIEGKLDNYTTYEYIIATFAIKLDKKHFPPRLTDMIRKVFESDNTSISMIIARTVLSKFIMLYSTMKTSSKFMNTYSERMILKGKTVKYLASDKKYTCKVVGIDSKSGALVVERKDGTLENIFSKKSVMIPRRVRLPRVKREQKT